ncbi:hypothetical protein LLH23_21075 [bacterium]|nr:hypothetical protein [bacterium]
MEVTLTWDEEKLGKLVEETRAARRRVRNVGWAMMVVGLLLAVPIGRALDSQPPANTTPTAPAPVAAPSVARPYAAPLPPPHPQHANRSGAIFMPLFWLGVGLLCWPALRPVAWVVLLLGSLLGLLGLAMLVIVILKLDPSVTPEGIPLCTLLVLLGAVQLYCSLILHRGSSIFACDYVRGEVSDWSVVLGLLSAEGPGYQRLREQVGLS